MGAMGVPVKNRAFSSPSSPEGGLRQERNRSRVAEARAGVEAEARDSGDRTPLGVHHNSDRQRAPGALGVRRAVAGWPAGAVARLAAVWQERTRAPRRRSQ